MAYEAQYKKSSDSSWIAVAGTFASTTYVTGLVNGTAYDFQVRVSPSGPWSNSVSATPIAPTLDVTVPTSSSLSGSFTAAGMTVSFKRDSTGVYLTFSKASWDNFTFTYIVNGVSYTQTVVKGAGATTSVLITMPSGVAVTIASIDPEGNGQVWTTGYTIAGLS